MDEVDIDNVEDLNELESRLYAQIHHEATEEPNVEVAVPLPKSDGAKVINTNPNNNGTGGSEENYETSVKTNRILSKRYWASSDHSAKQQHQQEQTPFPQHQQYIKQRFIRNPFKTPNKKHGKNKTDSPVPSNKLQNRLNTQQSKYVENHSTTSFTALKITEHLKNSPSNNGKSVAEKTTTANATESMTTLSTSTPALQEAALTPNENKGNKIAKTGQHSAKHKMSSEKSGLKLNPVANWMERNKQQSNKKSNNNNNVNGKNLKNSTTNIKQGPFAKQQQKLQKAKRLEDKKQKSKKAKNTAAALANKSKPTDIIDLDTDNESDSSDVVLIPTAPPPTYILDDSGDENDKDKDATIIEHEENALDSTDVQMSSTSTSFIKPQTLASAEIVEKRLENSSRCTSPCSIQSSDDFIGQNDRSRLLAGAGGMADDEDLLVLTSDMSSLLETPEIAKQAVVTDNSKKKEENPIESSVEQLPEETVETNDSLEFATPASSKQQSRAKDYRVDQSQFRALDVYESESDITDSVYSKGTNKTTVIRQIDTSSEEVEDISSCSNRTKRFHKRRASSSNKESDGNNEKTLSSSDNEDDEDAEVEEDDNKVLRTVIPFIARGVAVERYKPGKRSRTLSSPSPIAHKRRSNKTIASMGHMSDNEFLTTLNNLVQGQENEQAEQREPEPDLEEADESETENIPSARDIAEKILAQHNVKEKSNKTSEVAIPDDVLNELDKVFETIDQLDKRDAFRTQSSTPDDTVKISDSSDSDREKHLIYKSLPNEDAQIIKYLPTTTKKDKSPAKTHADNGSPIYNVIYSRGQRKPGGIGWSDEMRRFYNDSWNGEYFTVHKVLQKMNPDKNLWRIYTEDRLNIKSNKRYNNMKCTNCCEFGHMRSKCKRPKKPMICYMCGESGHYEPRCPNTICLRCGNKTQVFTRSCNACSYQNRLICPICKIRGHSVDYCPDKWRRYHSTTEANTYPNSSIQYNTRKFCCICGGRGHLSDNCRSAVRFMEYPGIVSTIKSHQKSYSDVVVKTPHNGIALNLMYEPCQEYKFDFAEITSADKYYGRFLKSVNLDFLLKRKHPINTLTTETADDAAKKSKRLSKKYETNPYSKFGTADQRNVENEEDAPNQVQEITESGNTEQQDIEENRGEQVVDIDNNNSLDTAGSDNEVDLVGSTVEDDDVANIQLNTINERPPTVEHLGENFKSPKNVTSTTLAAISKSQPEPPLLLDSDSNYSFSEHFDGPSTSVEASTISEIHNISQQKENSLLTTNSTQKPRQMETLPDFIPLIDSTEDRTEQNSDGEEPVMGISRKFVAAETDDEMEEEQRSLSPLPELPCEAKIYLTHFHSKYFLSPVGNSFLIKTSKAYKLNARLDFTSIGHVLVIFGLPSNQNKFQRELLMKYRELADESNRKQLQSNLNVPKRTYVLIRFLRENINQLLNNLGDVNQLLKRMQFLERQQSKSGYKLAEKVRKSLNMILVGQAGLQDGTMHLDKLLVSLKSLINDYSNEDVTPPQLRSEITDHWKVIFSPYRHDNYQQLVSAYNKLISKNRLPKLNIDPVLLGQKVLDVRLSEEQKEKLEQLKTTPPITNADGVGTETAKQLLPNPLNQKNTKNLKRKQGSSGTSPPSGTTLNTSNTNKIKISTSHAVSPATPSQGTADNSDSMSTAKTKSNSNSIASTSVKSNKTLANTTSVKAKTSSATTATANKPKPSTSATTSTTTSTSKGPPPPFAHPENHSTTSTIEQEVTDKWKSTCETLLTAISDERQIDSKIPSPFWSRESIRYLDECVRLAAARPNIVEKLERVQNKSKSGQLSFNDYLAVIKLHTALNEK